MIAIQAFGHEHYLAKVTSPRDRKRLHLSICTRHQTLCTQVLILLMPIRLVSVKQVSVTLSSKLVTLLPLLRKHILVPDIHGVSTTDVSFADYTSVPLQYLPLTQ